MTQLSYQPAFDPFNAVFRNLQIVSKAEVSFRFEALRICDFFLIFPFFLCDPEIRFKRNHRWIRQIGKKYEDRKPYGKLPEKKILFQRVLPFQVAAISSLVKSEILDHDAWADGEIKRTEVPAPNALAERILSENERNQDLMRAINTLLSEYDLSGRDGLKDRTGLLEYRYDAT